MSASTTGHADSMSASTTGHADAALGRTTLPFQYAWRFHYGDDPSSPPGAGPGTCKFEDDLQDYALCDGMEHNPNRFSEKDCRTACCYDPQCMVWQAFPIETGRACYHGYKAANVSCSKGGKPSGMGGGRRSASPDPAFRTDYAFAADTSSDVDVDWPVVDVPHDFISERANFTDDSTNFKQGYLPRNTSWYRKHFALPAGWAADGGLTLVHFEGVFHHTTLFLNGRLLATHECGYTGFTARLDNVSGVRFGGGAPNVLAVRADASFGSGHWYEGGGIFRPVWLTHVPPAHVVHDGLFVPPEGDGSLVTPSAEVRLPDGASPSAVAVRFTLLDGDTVLASNTTRAARDPAPALVEAAASATAPPTVTITAELRPARGAVHPWSTHAPRLYTVRAEVLATAADGAAAADNAAADAVEVVVGFRTAEWRAGDFALNGERFRLRGFSHHNSIGGLGVAVPPRVNLFRVQASRALGANIWRQSHNPYAPHLYALLDRVGTLCWDENRDYGAKYLGGAYVAAMRDMVKRDRSHPSVVVWSFCNEYECQQLDAGYSAAAFRAAALSVDGTRPLTANHVGDADLSAQLDVQGFSHKANRSFAAFHAQSPAKPAVLSECCSCTTDDNQRLGSRALPSCIAEENSPGLLPYVSGSLGVWTLMDYFGEPHGTGTSAWPYVSCDFGQFDIAGFPKPHAWWYAANWLQAVPPTDAGRPPLPAAPVVRLLDLPPGGADGAAGAAEQLTALTTAPFARLHLDGEPQAVLPAARDAFGAFTTQAWPLHRGGAPCAGPASFPHEASGVQCDGLSRVRGAATAEACAAACCAAAAAGCNTWQLDVGASAEGCWVGAARVGSCGAPRVGRWVGGQRTPPAPFRNATLVGLSARGPKAAVVGTHTLLAASANASAHRLALTLDVPSAATGTGGALLLDGFDTAMVRAAVVDMDGGALVAQAANRISWRVVSGPGRLAGVSNGDPTSHEWMKSTAVDAWGGLARGFVRVSHDCTSPGREMLAAVDVDAERGPTSVRAMCNDVAPIVLAASSPLLGEARLSIPVSADEAKDGVLAVASRGLPEGFSYLADFVG